LPKRRRRSPTIKGFSGKQVTAVILIVAVVLGGGILAALWMSGIIGQPLSFTGIPTTNQYTLEMEPEGVVLEGLIYSHTAVASANVTIYKQIGGEWVPIGTDTTDSAGIFDFAGVTILSGTPIKIEIVATGYYTTYYSDTMPYAFSPEQTEANLGEFYIADTVGAVSTSLFAEIIDVTNGFVEIDDESDAVNGLYDKSSNGTIVDYQINLRVTENDAAWGQTFGDLIDFTDSNEGRKCIVEVTISGGDYELVDLGFSAPTTEIGFSTKHVWLIELTSVVRSLDADGNPLPGKTGLWSFTMTLDTTNVVTWTSMILQIDFHDGNDISYYQEHSGPNTADDTVPIDTLLGLGTMQA